MPRGKKTPGEVSTVKKFTPKDAAELYSDPMFTDEAGIAQFGIHKGLPWWTAWFIARGADHNTPDDDNVYVLTDEEREAFAPLSDANHVIIRSEDVYTDSSKRQRKGFKFEIVSVSQNVYIVAPDV